jgi:HK97 family phage prohead protease
MDTERRFFAIEGLTVETREGKAPVIRGHAAVFGQLSEDLGGFREQIAPGAFASAIDGTDDVRALFNHDSNYILGRNRSKTLRLKEDARGLAIEIDAPDTQTIRDLVLAPIERGDVSQMSFGFSVRPERTGLGQGRRGPGDPHAEEPALFDVSPVVFPAYPQTDVGLRELRAWSDSQVIIRARHPDEALPRPRTAGARPNPISRRGGGSRQGAGASALPERN